MWGWRSGFPLEQRKSGQGEGDQGKLEETTVAHRLSRAHFRPGCATKSAGSFGQKMRSHARPREIDW